MTTATVAKVLVREVPLSQLTSFLKGHHGDSAMGDGCGGGCGGGAGCLDQNAHTGLSDLQIKQALKDTASLKAAVKSEIQAIGSHI